MMNSLVTERPPSIRADALTKRFRARVAVDAATFVVPRGTVTGFVGPNGAGKSTTLRMLVGLVRPTSGEGEVLGHSVASPPSYLHRIGALIEGPAFHAALSGRRNLQVLATLGGVETSRIDTVLELVELTDRADDRFKNYSLGMKQRLGIAAALLREPELLLLDEPTNGLDPAGIRDMRGLVARLASSGLTVLISSHLLVEVQSVCDWLVILQRGRLVYEGTVDDLLDQGAESIVVGVESPDQLDQVAELVTAGGYASTVEGARLRVAAPHPFAGDLNRACAQRGIVLTEVTPVHATLEERFLELTGGQA